MAPAATYPIAKSVLPAGWKVPELFRTRLGESAGRQRAMLADGHLLIVLHEPPRPGERGRQGRLFWREPDGQWKSSSLGPGVQAIKKHLTEYADAVARLDAQLDDADRADDYFAVLQAISPLLRAARHMHAALQQARELLPDDRDLVLLRDQAGEIERAAELLHGDAQNGLDFTVARQSEEQAKRSYEMAVSAHRLNVLAAIFLPIATLSALFGMNLEHGLPIRDNPAAFWVVLAAGFIGGVILTGIVTNAPTRPSTTKQPRSEKKSKRR
ncbi:MAG TPA: CorA family divalent cation transporter [Pirellulales bacterium]|nr:CorA family divalent cation transporter [Pirellulales bacterium]